MKRQLLDGSIETLPRGNMKRDVTKEQIVEALGLENYPQGKGHLLKDDEQGHIIDACAVGQCALNLGVSFDSLQTYLSNEYGWDAPFDLWWNITDLNDKQNKTPKQIARKLKSFWKSSLPEIVELEDAQDFFTRYSNWKGVVIRPGSGT